MKVYESFLIFLFCSWSINSYSQRDDVFLSFPEITTLFEGYDNLVTIQSKKRKNEHFVLECEGCITIKITDENSKENKWIIKTDKLGAIFLRVKNRSNQVIIEKKVQVLPIPYPNVFLDDANAQSIVKTLPEKIVLKLDQSVPTVIGFAIYKWEILIDDKVFQGVGSKLSGELRDYLYLKRKGIININIQYAYPLGKRQIKELFEFDFN
jgi:hypothetical protein